MRNRVVRAENEAMGVGPHLGSQYTYKVWAKDFLLWVVLGTKTQQTCFSLSPSLSLPLSLVFSGSPSSQFLLSFAQPPFLLLLFIFIVKS